MTLSQAVAAQMVSDFNEVEITQVRPAPVELLACDVDLGEIEPTNVIPLETLNMLRLRSKYLP